MPELDTYQTLKRFAENNTDLAAIQAYKFLKRRTELSVQWQVLRMAGVVDPKKALEFYTGVKDQIQAPTRLEDMSEAERMKLFEEACKQTNVQLDPSIFKKDSQ